MEQITLRRADLLSRQHGIHRRDTGKIPVPLLSSLDRAYQMHMNNLTHFSYKDTQNIPYNHYLEYNKIISSPAVSPIRPISPIPPTTPDTPILKALNRP